MAAIASNDTLVELNGHLYGTGFQNSLTSGQAQLPEFLIRLEQEILETSKLLQIQAGPDLQKPVVFEGYKHDLSLLRRYHFNLSFFIEYGVVEKSIKYTGGKNSTIPAQLREKCHEITGLIETPVIALPHTRAGKNANLLLIELRDELRRAIDEMLRSFSVAFYSLVEAELAGLIEWTDLDVCRYHYFMNEVNTTVTQESKANQAIVTTRTTYKSERHVHHLVQARVYKLDEYKQRLPKRIKRFLKQAPQWLKPHLHIVDGQMTMEEVITRKVGEEVETKVIATFQYDPGIILGEFNLIGWNESEIPRFIRSVPYYILGLGSLAGVVIIFLVAIFSLPAWMIWLLFGLWLVFFVFGASELNAN